jgi:uncharacterized protein YjbI with pentapeptide repeats
MWATTILFVGTLVLLFTSFFFNVPLHLKPAPGPSDEHGQAGNAAQPTSAAFGSLAVFDRTSKLRELLATESSKSIGGVSPDCTRFGGEHWPAPNAFAVQQVTALADINSKAVIQGLVPLLADSNVTVSSAALMAVVSILRGADSRGNATELKGLLPQSGAIATNLHGATLRNQDFTSLKSTAVLYGADMRLADLSGSNLAGLDMKMVQGQCATFNQSSLAGTNLPMSRLERATFWGASAPGASFRAANLQHTDFGRHDTRDPGSGIPFPTTTSYVPANLENADFGDAQAYDTIFSGARLGGARFRGASIARANFHGAFLEGMAPRVTEEFVRSLGPAVIDACLFDD